MPYDYTYEVISDFHKCIGCRFYGSTWDLAFVLFCPRDDTVWTVSKQAYF